MPQARLRRALPASRALRRASEHRSRRRSSKPDSPPEQRRSENTAGRPGTPPPPAGKCPTGRDNRPFCEAEVSRVNPTQISRLAFQCIGEILAVPYCDQVTAGPVMSPFHEPPALPGGNARRRVAAGSPEYHATTIFYCSAFRLRAINRCGSPACSTVRSSRKPSFLARFRDGSFSGRMSV